MKRTLAALLGLMALCALAGGASADGMARRGAPEPMVSGPGNWSGLYVGGSLGWAWSSDDVDWVYSTGSRPNAFSIDGWVGGGHIGVQHQFGTYVVGAEAQYFGGDDVSSSASCPNAAFSCSVTASQFLLLNAKLGYSGGPWLAYLTGGFASARIESNAVLTSNPATYEYANERHNGWNIGTGFDYMLGRHNLVFGIEYNFISLDSETHLGRNSAGTVVTVRDIDADFHVVRAKLSFLFGREGLRELAPLK